MSLPLQMFACGEIKPIYVRKDGTLSCQGNNHPSMPATFPFQSAVMHGCKDDQIGTGMSHARHITLPWWVEYLYFPCVGRQPIKFYLHTSSQYKCNKMDWNGKLSQSHRINTIYWHFMNYDPFHHTNPPLRKSLFCIQVPKQLLCISTIYSSTLPMSSDYQTVTCTLKPDETDGIGK